MPKLFDPFTIKDITLRNRVAVPPMCQYSATDGIPNTWHLAHYAELARGGAGLVIVEATGVSPDGRISPGCTGLWNDAQQGEHAKIAQEIKRAGAVAGLQIAYAGIKASANKPWEGDNHIPVSDPRVWEIIGSSAVPFGTEALHRTPRAMTKADIERMQGDFVAAAQRALSAGYEWFE